MKKIIAMIETLKTFLQARTPTDRTGFDILILNGVILSRLTWSPNQLCNLEA